MSDARQRDLPQIVVLAAGSARPKPEPLRRAEQRKQCRPVRIRKGKLSNRDETRIPAPKLEHAQQRGGPAVGPIVLPHDRVAAPEQAAPHAVQRKSGHDVPLRPTGAADSIGLPEARDAAPPVMRKKMSSRLSPGVRPNC